MKSSLGGCDDAGTLFREIKCFDTAPLGDFRFYVDFGRRLECFYDGNGTTSFWLLGSGFFRKRSGIHKTRVGVCHLI